MTHPKQGDWTNQVTADAPTTDDAPARARRSDARARVARTLAAALDKQEILDKEAAAQAGVKRQVVSQWARPGGTKNIGVAEASLLHDRHVRCELAQLIAGDNYRVVFAPRAREIIAADVATAGRLVRRSAHLVEGYLKAHEDGHLDPEERRLLLETLISPLVDDLLGLAATLRDDELLGERR